jgi:hypothetical protein
MVYAKKNTNIRLKVFFNETIQFLDAEKTKCQKMNVKSFANQIRMNHLA